MTSPRAAGFKSQRPMTLNIEFSQRNILVLNVFPTVARSTLIEWTFVQLNLSNAFHSVTI